MEHERDKNGARVHDGVANQLSGRIAVGRIMVRSRRLVMTVPAHDSTVARDER